MDSRCYLGKALVGQRFLAFGTVTREWCRQKEEKGEPMPAQDEIRCFVVGDIQTNCYAYMSDGACLVVDPGASGARIAAALDTIRVSQIVATHAHHDHVGGVKALVEATGAPWAIGANDAERAVMALEVSSHVFDVFDADRQEIADPPQPDQLLHEGDVLEVGTARFRVYETPGHTPGGIILLGEGSAAGVAFMGDTLFAGSCGRTDLLGGDWGTMQKTLARLRTLIDPSVTLLCGHGPATTMERELASNPHLQA